MNQYSVDSVEDVRMRLRLTKKEFADAIGCARPTYTEFSNGKAPFPEKCKLALERIRANQRAAVVEKQIGNAPKYIADKLRSVADLLGDSDVPERVRVMEVRNAAQILLTLFPDPSAPLEHDED